MIEEIPFFKNIVIAMQYLAALIFLVLTTVLVGFNRKMFIRISGENSKNMTWLFILFTAPLMCVVLFVFGIIFGKVDFVLLFKILTGKA
jgi:hypothetical protein